MKLKLRIIIALGVTLLLGYTVAASYQMPKQAADPWEAAQGDWGWSTKSYRYAPSLIVSSDYSTRCATKKGTCTLTEPQKVGSRCNCFDEKVPGRVVR